MPEQNQNPPEKMPLKTNREVPLSLYIYIVRPGEFKVPVHQNVSLIAAYTDEEAVQSLRAQIPAGQQFNFDFQGKMGIEQILGFFNQVTDIGSFVPNANVKQDKELEWLTKMKKDYYIEIINGMLKDLTPFVEKPEDEPILRAGLEKMLSIVQ